MDHWYAFLVAILSNTVSLWSGFIGLIATAAGLYYRNSSYGKMFIAGGVIALVFSSGLAWIEEHNIRLALEKELRADRPYLSIEELPTEEIKAELVADKNRAAAEGVYGKAFMVIQEGSREIFEYVIRNVTNSAAHNVRVYTSASILNQDGTESPVPIEKALVPMTSDVILPQQYVVRKLYLPAGTFYRSDKTLSSVRVRLAVVFSGQPSDKTDYYYKIAARIRQRVKPPPGDIAIESRDEGILKSLEESMR
jgi:hypothetical protein